MTTARVGPAGAGRSPGTSGRRTIDEVLANIREAIELHLADEDPAALGISDTAPILTTMQLEPLRA